MRRAARNLWFASRPDRRFEIGLTRVSNQATTGPASQICQVPLRMSWISWISQILRNLVIHACFDFVQFTIIFLPKIFHKLYQSHNFRWLYWLFRPYQKSFDTLSIPVKCGDWLLAPDLLSLPSKNSRLIQCLKAQKRTAVSLWIGGLEPSPNIPSTRFSKLPPAQQSS